MALLLINVSRLEISCSFTADVSISSVSSSTSSQKSSCTFLQQMNELFRVFFRRILLETNLWQNLENFHRVQVELHVTCADS